MQLGFELDAQPYQPTNPSENLVVVFPLVSTKNEVVWAKQDLALKGGSIIEDD